MAKKTKSIVLLASIGVILGIYFGIIIINSYYLDKKIAALKRQFNLLLKNKILKPESLRRFKILINNYELIKNKEISSELDINRIFKELENLTFYTDKCHLDYSWNMQLVMLGSILITPIFFSLKKIFNRS